MTAKKTDLSTGTRSIRPEARTEAASDAPTAYLLFQKWRSPLLPGR